MDFVTIKQMKNADKKAIEDFGIPAADLMQRAGNALARRALDMIGGANNPKAAVFCGPGNNGGDGWACSETLHKEGVDVTVFTAKEPDVDKAGAAKFHSRAKMTGVEIVFNKVPEDIGSFHIVIDAIFGIGLTREVSGIYEKYIELINGGAAPVLSADIPSGLSTDEGIPLNIAVKATETISFGKAKLCLFTEPGCIFAGKVSTDHIGIPEQAYDRSDLECEALDRNFAGKWLKKRKKITSKGDYGRVLVVAGSPGMTGAAALCAHSCYKSGSGLVYMAVPESKIFEYDSLVTEAVCIPVKDSGHPYISKISSKDIAKAAKKVNAVIIGPGMSEATNPADIYKELLSGTDALIVADAGLLRDMAENKDVLDYGGEKKKVIITPHPGEMAALTGESIENIQKNRISTAAGFAEKHNLIVLLKGHKTVVTDGRRVFINTTGNPGMATAGSGDVLCGAIASCFAICPDPLTAAALGVWIHGSAGDIAAVELGEYGITAGDMADKLALAIKKITGVREYE